MTHLNIEPGVRIGRTRLTARSISIGSGSHISSRVTIKGDSISIGRNVHIGSNVRIVAANITIDDNTTIKGDMTIDGLKDVTIGEYCILHRGFEARGQASLSIGDNSWFGDGVFIDATKPVIIEENCCLARDCLVLTHGHWAEQLEGYPVRFGPVTVKKNSWITPRNILMPGVTVGEASIVQPGSVISKDLGGTALYGGQPAKKLKAESDYKQPVDPLDKGELLKKYFFDRLREHGYTIDAIDNTHHIRGLRHSFIFSMKEVVKVEDIDKLIEEANHANTSETLIVSIRTVSAEIKDKLDGVGATITVFDLEKKTYRKVRSEVERLMKTLTYDRFARFTKELY